MSAPAAPQITLEQARQLVVFLENGEQDKADQLILDTASQEQSQLFAEVGKLTRQLHEALKSFELDTSGRMFGSSVKLNDSAMWITGGFNRDFDTLMSTTIVTTINDVNLIYLH